ncbi:MAG: radical SAM protein, partial [Patescibacteria group bacterium]
MNKAELGRSNSPENRYQKNLSFISAVVNERELGYIYTFPDKRLYKPVEDSSSFINDAWKDYEGEIGIYVHIPYCKPKPPPTETKDLMKKNRLPSDGRDHLCGYCNLFTVVAKEIPGGFTDSVVREINLYKQIFQNKNVQPTSMYFGGGSPSLLQAKDLGLIVDNLENTLGKVPVDKEKTIECIPDSVDYEKLTALHEIGFNRVSIGVQTFDERVLHYSGRNYDPKLAEEAIRNALDIGFLNVNADLIIGLPSSSSQTFLKDIELIRKLSPHTITLYQDMTR